MKGKIMSVEVTAEATETKETSANTAIKNIARAILAEKVTADEAVASLLDGKTDEERVQVLVDIKTCMGKPATATASATGLRREIADREAVLATLGTVLSGVLQNLPG